VKFKIGRDGNLNLFIAFFGYLSLTFFFFPGEKAVRDQCQYFVLG
jgi:hypothetical protein